MNTFSEVSASPATQRDPQVLRRQLLWLGYSGLLGVVLLLVFVPLSSRLGADPLASSTAQLRASLAAHSGTHLAAIVLAESGLSYAPLIVFFAALFSLMRRWEPTGIAAGVTAIGAAMFLAGALAGDGFSMAVVIAQNRVGHFQPDGSIARVFGAGWQICLVKAHVALGTVCGVAGYALVRATRSDARRLPRWVGIWGVVAAVAVLPLVIAPSTLPVFIGSNLVRLGWILVMSVTSLILARRCQRAEA